MTLVNNTQRIQFEVAVFFLYNFFFFICFTHQEQICPVSVEGTDGNHLTLSTVGVVCLGLSENRRRCNFCPTQYFSMAVSQHAERSSVLDC